jgi:apolipoprotein N-acyltransferase
MRGVENEYSIARSARGGFMTVSDAKGRIVAEKRSDAEPFSTLVAKVPVSHETTVYSKLGNWFGWVAIGLLVVALGRLVI